MLKTSKQSYVHRGDRIRRNDRVKKVLLVVGLVVAGVLGARVAGGAVLRPALRVLLGGGLAMLVTAAVGQLAHVSGI